MKMNLSLMFVSGMVLALVSTGCCEAKNPAPVDIDRLLGLIENLGPIESKTEQKAPLPQEMRIVVKTQRTQVYFILQGNGTYLRSIQRSVIGATDKPLEWTREQAVEKGTHYRKLFLNEDDFPAPDYVLKDHLSGGKSIWAVEWTRRIKGYQVLEDFISVNFDEEDGLYGLTRHWEVPEDIKIPDQVVEEVAAKKAAGKYGMELIAKNPNRFAGFLLGEVDMVNRMLVTPNPEFEEARLIKLFKFDSANLRPAWVITFVNIDDPEYKGGTRVRPSSTITIWVDVETGAYLGSIF